MKGTVTVLGLLHLTPTARRLGYAGRRPGVFLAALVVLVGAGLTGLVVLLYGQVVGLGEVPEAVRAQTVAAAVLLEFVVATALVLTFQGFREGARRQLALLLGLPWRRAEAGSLVYAPVLALSVCSVAALAACTASVLVALGVGVATAIATSVAIGLCGVAVASLCGVVVRGLALAVPVVASVEGPIGLLGGLGAAIGITAMSRGAATGADPDLAASLTLVPVVVAQAVAGRPPNWSLLVAAVLGLGCYLLWMRVGLASLGDRYSSVLVRWSGRSRIAPWVAEVVLLGRSGAFLGNLLAGTLLAVLAAVLVLRSDVPLAEPSVILACGLLLGAPFVLVRGTHREVSIPVLVGERAGAWAARAAFAPLVLGALAGTILGLAGALATMSERGPDLVGVGAGVGVVSASVAVAISWCAVGARRDPTTQAVASMGYTVVIAALGYSVAQLDLSRLALVALGVALTAACWAAAIGGETVRHRLLTTHNPHARR